MDPGAESLPGAEVLSGIIEAGVRRRLLRSPVLRDLSVLAERLAALPEATDIERMPVSDEGQERLDELLEKNREGGLTDEERREWEAFERLVYLVRAAKAQAAAR